MVKPLDEIMPPLLDHAGWRLWRLSRQWKACFDAGMRERGYPRFGEARSNVIGFLERDGIPQSELVKRMGLSKQAVQQLVDELVIEGVVARQPNPLDKRGNIVVFTRSGLSMLAEANAVKLAIEDTYREKLGAKGFRDLIAALRELDDGGDS
jgi:DNA-binding MarR family transcriptional regulator